MKFFVAAFLFAASALAAAPAFAAVHVCLNIRDIVSSTSQSHGAAILFKMRDGSQWRNNLQGRCPDLDFYGWAWTIRNPDQSVCENEQTLRVLQSGETCALGKFEKVTQAHPG